MTAFLFASSLFVAAASTPAAAPSVSPAVSATAAPVTVVPPAAASAAPVPRAAAPAAPLTPAVPVRRLEYAVSEKSDGDFAASTLALDLTAINAGSALTFLVVDRRPGSESAPLNAHLDRHDGMTVTGDGGFSDREEVLLALFELSFEDVGRLEKGETWVRTERTPDGTATTTYQVLGALGSLLDFSVKHEVDTSGYTSTWQGRVVYDAISRAPTSAEFSGQSAIQIKLASDSLVAQSR